VLLVSYTQTYTAGAVITLTDANGRELLRHTSAMPFSASGFTSPAFTIGETYSLLIDGRPLAEIKLTGVLTAVSDDGGAYRSGWGRGGPGGQPGGPGGEPPPRRRG
jgi:hypothetical protein